jgi:hypothetical protein
MVPARGAFESSGKVSDVSESQWIRSFALAPRRLSEGGWVWLRPYEWRWQRPTSVLPNAVNPPRVYSRRPSSQAMANAGR